MIGAVDNMTRLWTGGGFMSFLSVVPFLIFAGLSPVFCRTPLSEILVLDVDEKLWELQGETLGFEHPL